MTLTPEEQKRQDDIIDRVFDRPAEFSFAREIYARMATDLFAIGEGDIDSYRTAARSALLAAQAMQIEERISVGAPK